MNTIQYPFGGLQDKFIGGDCIMAMWNAPLAVPNHAALAVKSLITMQHRIQKLSKVAPCAQIEKLATQQRTVCPKVNGINNKMATILVSLF